MAIWSPDDWVIAPEMALLHARSWGVPWRFSWIDAKNGPSRADHLDSDPEARFRASGGRQPPGRRPNRQAADARLALSEQTIASTLRSPIRGMRDRTNARGRIARTKPTLPKRRKSRPQSPSKKARERSQRYSGKTLSIIRIESMGADRDIPKSARTKPTVFWENLVDYLEEGVE